MSDYIPRKENDLAPWANNLKEKLSNYSVTLGLTPEEVAAVGDSCDSMDKGISNAVSATAAAKKAVKEKDMTVTDNKAALRAIIQRIKKSDGYTPAIGEDLKIIGTYNPINPVTYKSKLTGVVLVGKVNVKFTKKGVTGVNIYSRMSSTDKWTKLDFASRSPYADKRPLAVAGTAEVRQYMGVGVIDNEEIGQVSDIIEVVFAG